MTESDRRVRGISRRAWLGGGAAGSVALLAACAGSGAGQQPAAAPQQDLKGTTIDFWAWNGPAHPETLAVQHLMEDFNTKNTAGIKVNFSAPSTGGQTTYEKYVTALTGGCRRTPPSASTST